jgi:ankyrin repeat protein
VKLLLKNGAQPDFEDEGGCKPLSRAIETGNAAVVELLLAQGAKVDYRYRIVSKFNRFTLDRQLTLSSFTIAGSK